MTPPHQALVDDLRALGVETSLGDISLPDDLALLEALDATLACEPEPLEPGAFDALLPELEAIDRTPPAVSVRCTYCHDGLAEADRAYCAECLAAHHPDCFEEHARCSAPGCRGTRWVRASAPPPRPRRTLAPLLVLLGGGLATAAYGVTGLLSPPTRPPRVGSGAARETPRETPREIGLETARRDASPPANLSELGQALYALTKPRERAWRYLVHHGLQAGVDPETAAVERYCPPQPTVYDWLVTFRAPGGRRVLVAVSEGGRTWELTPETLGPVRPDEFARGGLLPTDEQPADPWTHVGRSPIELPVGGSLLLEVPYDPTDPPFVPTQVPERPFARLRVPAGDPSGAPATDELLLADACAQVEWLYPKGGRTLLLIRGIGEGTTRFALGYPRSRRRLTFAIEISGEDPHARARDLRVRGYGGQPQRELSRILQERHERALHLRAARDLPGREALYFQAIQSAEQATDAAQALSASEARSGGRTKATAEWTRRCGETEASALEAREQKIGREVVRYRALVQERASEQELASQLRVVLRSIGHTCDVRYRRFLTILKAEHGASLEGVERCPHDPR